LPDPTAIEHHRAVEYRISDHALQTSGFTVTPSTDGRSIEVTGVCPGCGGKTTTTWDYGTGNGYKGLFPRRPAVVAVVPSGARTVCCDCGHAHPNRPDDAVFLGCGAYWQVQLP
jgi:hypothetical protein